MPYELSVFHLPGGARAARVRCIGTLLGEEATSMLKEWNADGPMHDLPALVLTQELEAMTAEARSFLSGRRERSPTEWFAVVVTNPVMRVVGNFFARVSGTKRQRLFSTEAEAIKWLDERALENAAR